MEGFSPRSTLSTHNGRTLPGPERTHHTAAHRSRRSNPADRHSACWMGCRCHSGSGTHCTSCLECNSVTGKNGQEETSRHLPTLLGGTDLYCPYGGNLSVAIRYKCIYAVTSQSHWEKCTLAEQVRKNVNTRPIAGHWTGVTTSRAITRAACESLPWSTDCGAPTVRANKGTL